MKIAFDYDDTLDQAYDLFSVITQSLIAAGHEVYIVTHICEEYRPHREAQLKKHRIAYTELVITGDKFNACQERGIEYIFDDCPNYFPDTKHCLFDVFNIPKRKSATLPDGTKIEVTLLTSKYSYDSGPRAFYHFRYLLTDSESWSAWLMIQSTQQKQVIHSRLNEFKQWEDLFNEWHPKL